MEGPQPLLVTSGTPVMATTGTIRGTVMDKQLGIYVRHRLGGIFSCIASCLLTLVSATASTQPSIPGNLLAINTALPLGVAAGRTPASFGVSNSGAATYTIPLWTPPGVGDVELHLALVYNNRA